VCQSVWENVASGDLDCLFEKIVLKDNETVVHGRDISKDIFPVLEHLLDGGKTAVDIEIIGIKCSKGTDTSPHDGSKTHRQGDRTNTVINITVRRAHHVGGNTGDILDDLLGPTQLSNDFLIGKSGQGGVRPGVDCKLVLTHVLFLEGDGEGDGTGADDEEGGLEVVLIQELE